MQENASHVISLPLFKLNLPERSLFEPQIKQLTEKSFALENRKLKIRDSKLIGHYLRSSAKTSGQITRENHNW